MQGAREASGLDEAGWQRLVACAARLAGPKGDLRTFLSARAREGTAVVGDRAYDSDAFLAHVRTLRMRAVVPSTRSRRRPRRLDRARYAQRNVVERWFGRMKVFRRVATRYDKTSASYAGFVFVAAMLVTLTRWLG